MRMLMQMQMHAHVQLMRIRFSGRRVVAICISCAHYGRYMCGDGITRVAGCGFFWGGGEGCAARGVWRKPLS